MSLLRSQIRDVLDDMEGKVDDSFLPYSSMKSLVTETTVTEILTSVKSISEAKIPKLVDYILKEQGAMRVFVILLWTGQVRLIEAFHACNFVDNLLPVYKDHGKVRTQASRTPSPEIVNQLFYENMEEYNIDFFCDSAQWRFLAPVFREKQFKYDFHPKCPMPYLTPSLDTKTGHKDSHFSVVEQRCIHKDHLKKGSKTRVSLDKNGHPVVAIKQLRNVNWAEQDFQAAAETEADVLEMMRDFNHPHLIRAIAYYTRGNKHYLVFPWADGGNLRDLWESEPPHNLDGEFFKWAFDQFCGLASAIERLHSTPKACRHGDLKPENILCFENTGHTHPRTQPWLVIADVGLAKVHNQATHLRYEATRTVIGTIMYEPPEVDLTKLQPRSRRYDVWSLGCIYLEFLIWILFGKDQLTRFGNDIASAIDVNRTFFEVNAGTAGINPSVQKWIDTIKKDRRVEGNTAVRRLLDLICNRLLVVALGNVESSSSGSGNQTRDVILEANGPGPEIIRTENPDYRATAREMHSTLRAIQKEALGSRASEPKLQWMNWEPATEVEDGYLDDIESIASYDSDMPSLTTGSTASSVISQALTEIIVQELLAMFRKDDEMLKLLELTPRTIHAEKFKRNFRRLIERMAADMRAEFGGADREIRQAVRALKRQSLSIAAHVFENFLQPDLVSDFQVELASLETDYDQRISAFLIGTDDTLGETIDSKEPEVFPPAADSSSSESDSDSQDLHSYDRIKIVVSNSTSYSKFKSHYRETFNASSKQMDSEDDGALDVEPMDDIEDVPLRALNATNWFAFGLAYFDRPIKVFMNREFAWASLKHGRDAWNALKSSRSPLLCNAWEEAQSISRAFMKRGRRSLRPKVKVGYERLEWTCDCGEDMYADFDTHEPDSAREFRKFLEQEFPQPQKVEERSIESTQCDQDDQSRKPSVPKDPNTSPLTPSHVADRAPSKQKLSSNNQAVQKQQETTGQSTRSRTPSPIPTRKRFLELCVNVGNFEPRLAEIDASRIKNDSQLFVKIRETYHEVRGFRNRLFLRTPVDVHFVQFSLDERHRAGVYKDRPVLPNEDQMVTKGYHYSPCPMKPAQPIPIGTFLHYFLVEALGAHKGLKWGQRIPHKMDASIHQDKDVYVVGWGIHVIEGLNKLHAIVATLCIVLISGIFSVVWTAVKGDIQGGFGIGSWIASVLAIILMLVLAKWNEI